MSAGCDGGDPIDVFRYMRHFGLPDESCQLYNASDYTKWPGAQIPQSAFGVSGTKQCVVKGFFSLVRIGTSLLRRTPALKLPDHRDATSDVHSIGGLVDFVFLGPQLRPGCMARSPISGTVACIAERSLVCTCTHARARTHTHVPAVHRLGKVKWPGDERVELHVGGESRLGGQGVSWEGCS
jgi:hypothetical protein